MTRSLTLAVLVVAATVAQATVLITRVWTGPRTEEDFVSIREYFGGGERSGGDTILRTSPRERAGFYWLVRARGKAARVRLQWAPWEGTETRERSWELPPDAMDGAILLGLTGSDAPPPGREPLAWRISFLDANGAELAARESFLWRAP